MTKNDTRRSDLLVSVVCAIEGAGTYIEGFVRDVCAELDRRFKDYELVLVDNVSRDDTLAIVERLQDELRNVQLYCLTRSVDHDTAFVIGLERAVGDVVVTVDAECDPPGKITDMLAIYDEGGADVVYGLRSDRIGPRMGIYNRLSRNFYAFYGRLTGERLPDAVSTFRLCSRRVLNSFLENRDRYVLFSVGTSFAGYNYREMPYDLVRHGKTRRHGLIMPVQKALRILLFSSQQPLRMLSIASLTGAFLNLVYSGYVVAIRIFKSHVVEGWTSLSLQSSFMFFLLFIILAALCEYVGRMFMHGQDRPGFVIAKERRSLVLSRKEDPNVDFAEIASSEPGEAARLKEGGR